MSKKQRTRYFDDIHEMSIGEIEEKIESIRVQLQPRIRQESNMLFTTVKTLSFERNENVRKKRLWIFYVTLQWLLYYSNYDKDDIPREIIDQFGTIWHEHHSIKDDDLFIDAVKKLG